MFLSLWAEMASGSIMTTGSQVIAPIRTRPPAELFRLPNRPSNRSPPTRSEEDDRRIGGRRAMCVRMKGECLVKLGREGPPPPKHLHHLTRTQTHTLFLYRAGLRGGDTMWQCVTSPRDKVSKHQRPNTAKPTNSYRHITPTTNHFTLSAYSLL